MRILVGMDQERPVEALFVIFLNGSFWPIPACRDRLVSTHCRHCNASLPGTNSSEICSTIVLFLRAKGKFADHRQ
jgi:hypothetical protein